MNEYPDGVWLIDLAPVLDPDLVPRTTATTIGLREEPQRPVIDMLCDYLSTKKMLIILDNCEHLVDACANMSEQILRTASDVRILASSREALGVAGEVTYRVPSLRLPDRDHLPSLEAMNQYEAVKLFIDRATAALPSFTVTNENAPALAQVCHRLDGIPLAIELAAAKVRVLSLDQIAKRLDDRFRLLTGGRRTALERHQTLRAAVDWSYNLLPPEEQTLFKRLSVFVGGWTLEAAESVCADESSSGMVGGEDVLNLLEQLINKSLVITEEEHRESRYHMLETMRQYASEKLVESGESDILHDRHLHFLVELVETAEPHLRRAEQLEWFSILDDEHENLRTALNWSLDIPSSVPGLRLAGALGPYWRIREHFKEGIDWLESLLKMDETAESSGGSDVRGKALLRIVELLNETDDIEPTVNDN
jgi:non-specific serine/threonine protein kinase